MRAIIGQWTATKTQEQVIKALIDVRIPAAPVWDLKQLTEADHVAARGLVVEGDHSKFGKVPLVRQPVKFSGSDDELTPSTPLLGEHTDEVLSDIAGFTKNEIEDLKNKKAI